MAKVISEEQASLIWAEQLETISNDEINEEATHEEKPQETPEIKGEKNIEEAERKIEEEEPSAIFAEEEEEEEEEEVSEKQTTQQTKQVKETKSSKKSDISSFVAQLLEEDGFSYEGGEISNIDEAKDVVKEYIKSIKEEAIEESWKEKVKGYSSQVQALLAYADQGAQTATELLDLLSAVKDVEDVVEFDLSSRDGKLQAIEAYYHMKGFKPNYIKKQLDMLNDAGDDVIDETASEFAEELLEFNKRKVSEKIRQKEQARKAAEEASRAYLQTITDTLKKDNIGDIKLTKQDRYNLFDAVSNAEYQSISGSRVTKFIKTLEEIQFGKEKNYEHFMNIVYFTVDPQGFMQKIKDKITAEVSEDTMKKLRVSKKTSQNTEIEPKADPKKVIKKTGFRNPWA